MDYVLLAVDYLKKLTAIPSPSGFTRDAAEFCVGELEKMGYAPTLTNKGGVLCSLGGESSESPLLLTAHIDTLGAMVREVKSNGRLKISSVGGIQPNNTEGENCKIITRFGKIYDGTFQLNEPSVHVNREYAKEERSFDTMEVVVDEKVKSKEDAKALMIDAGDYVCFDPRTVVTESGYIKSRFLDDKLSVAILLSYAKKLKDEKRIPKRETILHITVYEEVGHGGSSIPKNVTEVLGVDMGCVGTGLECDEHMVSICAKDSRSPSDYDITSKLIKAAKDNDISYAVDVYPYYGSDADAALDSGNDIKHCLIGAGVYASHGYERSHKDGVLNTLKLIDVYVDL